MAATIEEKVDRIHRALSWLWHRGDVCEADRRAMAEIMAEVQEMDRKVICIDAGHGGKDPGAVGNGLREKDVVWCDDHDATGGLGMANRIGHYLRKAGHETVYTRYSDRYVALRDRAAAAVSKKCDLFLSVHCNSASASSATGIEAYVHPQAYRREAALASGILKAIAALPESSGIRVRGVKTARFAVLSGTYRSMPAILLELPFVSNSKDAALLADRYWRDAAAKAIAGSIRRFLG